MGHLTKAQGSVLALWSYGMVLAKTCGMTRVVAALGTHLGEKEGNLRQRLREWCWDKSDKQGQKRTDWQVAQSFGPLLKWILAQWDAEERQIVLAMDATSLKERFVVLSISGVYRGCAIPVAWATQKGAWKAPWLDLFQYLRGSIPADWLVIVMADRGLYARWLYQAIQENAWHPFLRINSCSHYRPKAGSGFRPVAQLLPSPKSSWTGLVTCFAKNSLETT